MHHRRRRCRPKQEIVMNALKKMVADATAAAVATIEWGSVAVLDIRLRDALELLDSVPPKICREWETLKERWPESQPDYVGRFAGDSAAETLLHSLNGLRFCVNLVQCHDSHAERRGDQLSDQQRHQLFVEAMEQHCGMAIGDAGKLKVLLRQFTRECQQFTGSGVPQKNHCGIPPGKRTRPMTKKEAAKILRPRDNPKAAVRWLTQSIADGSYRFEKLPNSYKGYFHMDDDWPAGIRDKLKG